MSDGTLSQDEIDALLQGTDELMTESMGTTSSGGFGGGPSVSGESLSEADKAILGELLREIGNAQATSISTLVPVAAKFSSPFIDSGQLDALRRDIKGKVIQAKITISGGLTGEWVFAVPEKSVLTITNLLIGQEDNTDVSDLVINNFQEVISLVVSSMSSVLTDKLGKPITPGMPHLEYLADPNQINIGGGTHFVRMNYVFNLEGKGSAKFFAFLPISMARSIVSSFNASKASQTTAFGGSGGMQQQAGVPVKPVAFEPLQMGVESEAMGNIALLLDVPMRVTVELGRTKMTIKDILGLGEGSIIELDKLAGEPVDILVNDKLIAQGEVVVIDENFAVRVTKIVTPMERIFDSTESQM